MSTVAVSPAPEPVVDESRALWAVTRYEALRLVRHPIFLIAALLFIYGTASTPFNEYANASYDAPPHGDNSNLDYTVQAAFLLGLGGLIAMNRITSSSGRSAEVLNAAPMAEPRRTLALCLACLVPGGLALLGAGFVFYFWMTDPPVHTENWGEFSNAELAAVLACGVLAALGGSLLGVLTARWWRWPTAAAVTCVLLIMWSIAGLVNDTNALLTLNHLGSPFTLVSSNGDEWSWHLGGSWLWRVPYLVGLCALAAIGACAHGSDGELRRRQVRWATVVGVLTLAVLLIGTFTGPEGYYSWDDR
ncbi:MAG: hypothetical protein ABWX84_08960 [Nocardioides sp.]